MKHKDELNATELDYRGRLSLLEQQLQKQRERSLSLLEEKEQEILTLKSTFQIFLPLLKIVYSILSTQSYHSDLIKNTCSETIPFLKLKFFSSDI